MIKIKYQIEETPREGYPDKPVFYIRKFLQFFKYKIDLGLMTERYDDGEYSGKNTLSFWSLDEASNHIKRGFVYPEKESNIIIHEVKSKV